MNRAQMAGGFANKKSLGRKYAIFGTFCKALKANDLPKDGVFYCLQIRLFNII